MQRLIIDPGHGGQDPGAVNTKYNIKEKKWVWEFAYKVRKHLKPYYDSLEVVIIQPSERITDIGDEELNIVCDTIRLLRGEFLLSIHANAGGGTGFETYVHPIQKGKQADTMRTIFHNNLAQFYAKYNLPDRGKKYANYMILRRTMDIIPGLLLEAFFIDNQRDLNLALDEKFCNELANEVAYSAVSAMGIV